jgi:hypothetical protein
LNLENMSTEELQKFITMPGAVDPHADFAKGYGAGLRSGIEQIGAIPGEARELGKRAGQEMVDWFRTGGTGRQPWKPEPMPLDPNSVRGQIQQALTPFSGMPTLEEIKGQTNKVFGQPYAPQGAAGRIGYTAGELTPGLVLAPGGAGGMGIARPLANATRYVLAPAAAKEGARDIVGPDSRWSEPAQIAAMLAAPSVAGRMITPLNIEQGRSAMAAALRGERVAVSPGDLSGGRNLKAFESQMQPGAYDDKLRQFTDAALRRGNVTAPPGLPLRGQGGIIDTHLTNVGRQFDGLQARNTAQFDHTTFRDLQAARDEINALPGVNDPQTVAAVNGAADHVMNAFFPGRPINAPGMPNIPPFSVNGTDYQLMRSRLSTAAREASDPAKARGLHAIVDALDDTMERSIANRNPADLGAWQQTRRDYRNALVLERAAASAGPAAANSIITPAQLDSAAKAVYGKRAVVRGQDDFSSLSTPGVALLGEPPNSETARRFTVEGIGRALGAGLGATAGGTHPGGGVEHAVLGTLLGEELGPLVARPVVRGAYNNPLTRWWLTNEAVQHVPLRDDAVRAAIMARALLDYKAPASLPPPQSSSPPARAAIPY